MTPEQADIVRKHLRTLLQGGPDPTELSRRIGRGKDYIRDFLSGRKLTLGAVEVAAIERELRLHQGDLLSRSRDSDIVRVPVGEEFAPDPVDPRMLEGTEGQDVGNLPADAILEADLRIGMGGGGISSLSELMHPDGNTYAAEGIRDWFRLPEHVVSGRFRVSAKRIRCFEAVSDSMQPTVYDGDMVFIDIGHRVPSPPGIYALADVLGGVILKRLEVSSARGRPDDEPIEVRIISDNPKHTAETRTLDEISIVGRYLGRLTTF